ncbi:MAG TPA: hypothetical protein VNA20_04715 [Frankiaceae bacterium]|nr:hypothetical protein [Frankiaceae bacterium]
MVRALAVAAALAGGVLVAPADAAPPAKACRLVRDAVGDTDSPMPDADLDRQLDITSADVATGAKNLTVVLRLAALTAADPANPQGRVYEFDFTAVEKNFIVMGSLLPGGNSFSVFISETRLEENESGARAATGIGSAVGVVDVAKKEIRMTAPLSVFAPHAPIGRKTPLVHLAAFTYRANGYSAQPAHEMLPVEVEITGDVGLGVDQAWGRMAYYRAGTPSCVRAG